MQVPNARKNGQKDVSQIVHNKLRCSNGTKTCKQYVSEDIWEHGFWESRESAASNVTKTHSSRQRGAERTLQFIDGLSLIREASVPKNTAYSHDTEHSNLQKKCPSLLTVKCLTVSP